MAPKLFVSNAKLYWEHGTKLTVDLLARTIGQNGGFRTFSSDNSAGGSPKKILPCDSCSNNVENRWRVSRLRMHKQCIIIPNIAHRLLFQCTLGSTTLNFSWYSFKYSAKHSFKYFFAWFWLIRIFFFERFLFGLLFNDRSLTAEQQSRIGRVICNSADRQKDYQAHRKWT